MVIKGVTIRSLKGSGVSLFLFKIKIYSFIQSFTSKNLINSIFLNRQKSLSIYIRFTSFFYLINLLFTVINKRLGKTQFF